MELGRITDFKIGTVLCVDNDPVIFYHFQGLRKIAPGVIDPVRRQRDKLRVSWLMEIKLFRPYLRQLQQEERLVKTLLPRVTSVGGLPRFNCTDKPMTFLARIRSLLRAYRVLARRFLLSAT